MTRWTAFEELKSKAIAMAPPLKELAERIRVRHEVEIDLEPTEAAIDVLSRQKCLIAVLGRQKAGKSTLLNALAGDGAEVSPVDAVTCTSAFSVLAHGKKKRFARVHVLPGVEDVGGSSKYRAACRERSRQILIDLGGRRSASTASSPFTGKAVEINLGRLPEWVTHEGNPANHKRVLLAEVFSTSPLLENGLVLVDAPGIGALAAEDEAVAKIVAEEVDAAILLYRKEANLGSEELSFIAQTLALRKSSPAASRPAGRPFFLVQNDSAPSSDDDPAEHEAGCKKVQETMSREIRAEWRRRQSEDPAFPRSDLADLRVFRVNAKRAAKGALTGNAQLTEESGIRQLWDALIDFRRYGQQQLFLRTALQEMSAQLGAMAGELSRRIPPLQGEAKDSEAMLQAIQDARDRLDSDGDLSLQRFEAVLQDALRADIAADENTIASEITAGVERVLDLANQDLDEACRASDRMLADAVDRAVLHIAQREARLGAVWTDEYRRLHDFAVLITAALGRFGTAAEAIASEDRPKVDIKADVSLDGELWRWIRRKILVLIDSGAKAAVKASLTEALQKAGTELTKSLTERTRVMRQDQHRLYLSSLRGRRMAFKSSLDGLARFIERPQLAIVQDRRTRLAALEEDLEKLTEMIERVKSLLGETEMVTSQEGKDAVRA